MERLYDKLVNYSKEDYYPMHMPGHKRNTGLLSMVNPYAIDITEINGFDNLHKAEGIIKELSLRLGKLYGSGRAYPLVNGSTVGILAGICAAVNKGDRVLAARNSHKAVYHAFLLKELKPVYVYPEKVRGFSVNGGILPEKIEELLIKQPDTKLVIITSPTYEGVVSDVEAIASAVHKHGAFLLVDEAHGAHFGFHKEFPKSAVKSGADLVIQSLHKTLPAFTQSAVLHSNRPELDDKIEQYLAIYESSSPSYLLMSGIDRCVSLLEDQKEQLFDAFSENLKAFYHSIKTLKQIRVMNKNVVGNSGIYDLDPSKLTIQAGKTGLTGHELSLILREKYHIIMEMEARDYVLGMTSICDTAQGFHRLSEALLEIDAEYKGTGIYRDLPDTGMMKPRQAMAPYMAMEHKTQTIALKESSGYVSAVFVSLFPPGIPLLAPGEIIEESFIGYMDMVKREGLTVTGLCRENPDQIEVLL